MLRRARTEHAKMVRRLTGTNSFQDKVLVRGSSEFSSTLTTTPAIENLILEELYD